MCGSTSYGACHAVFILKLCEPKRKNYAIGIKYVMIVGKIFLIYERRWQKRQEDVC